MNLTPDKKIKLLVITQYYYPEQFRINDLCAEWVKRGYDVTVITGIPNYPKGKFYQGYGWFKKRREIRDGVKIIRLPIISRGKSRIQLGLNYLSFMISGCFWQALTRYKADLVFSFEVSPMTQVLPAIWFANRRSVPCVVYIQDLWPENFQEATGIKNGPLISLITRMADYIYRKSSLILVTSNSFKKVIEKRGIPSEKVVYWPQYAEDYYKSANTVSSLVPPDERLTIAFTGNIGTSQGLEILPKSASTLRDRGVRVRFILVGDGRGMPMLKKSIDDLGVSDYFYFVPQQPPQSIPSILAGADAAFISFAAKPLFSMTIPAKLQSYMACGMPIIGAVTGESEKIITEAECGLVCSPGDASALAQTIECYQKLPVSLRKTMGRNATKYSELHFNKDHLILQIEKVFESVTASE